MILDLAKVLALFLRSKLVLLSEKTVIIYGDSTSKHKAFAVWCSEAVIGNFWNKVLAFLKTYVEILSKSPFLVVRK